MLDSNSGNISQTLPHNSMININRAWDVNFWCEELNLRAEELKEIVKLVGPSIHEIRLHISKKLLLAWPSAY